MAFVVFVYVSKCCGSCGGYRIFYEWGGEKDSTVMEIIGRFCEGGVDGVDGMGAASNR